MDGCKPPMDSNVELVWSRLCTVHFMIHDNIRVIVRSRLAKLISIKKLFLVDSRLDNKYLKNTFIFSMHYLVVSY